MKARAGTESADDQPALSALEMGILEGLLLSMKIAWCRPMDVGGSNGSPHSAILSRLSERGLVAARLRGNTGLGRTGKWGRTGKSRGSKRYRITVAGADCVIAHLRMERGGVCQTQDRAVAFRSRQLAIAVALRNALVSGEDGMAAYERVRGEF